MGRRSNLRRRPNGRVSTDYFPVEGGLNLADSALDIPPGAALSLLNYEVLPRKGYRRIDGFERTDGQGLASDASYWILNFDVGTQLTGAPVDGGICTGITSGANGEVLSVVLESGSWAGNDATGYIALTDVVGDFQDNETLAFTGAGDEFTYEFSGEFA